MKNSIEIAIKIAAVAYLRKYNPNSILIAVLNRGHDASTAKTQNSHPGYAFGDNPKKISPYLNRNFNIFLSLSDIERQLVLFLLGVSWFFIVWCLRMEY